MKLAISTLSFIPPFEDKNLERLAKLGVSGLEVAPLTLWSNWDSATREQAILFRERAARYGLSIPAIQGIVFRAVTTGLVEAGGGTALAAHFERVTDLADALGARVAVLGAPALRRCGELTLKEAKARAIEALHLAIRPFAAKGLVLGLEPVPASLGCELGCTAKECAELIRLVDSPALQLHLDSAALWEAGEELVPSWPLWGDLVCHVHLSEPGLKALRGGVVPHSRNLAALEKMGYNGWVSIEMNRPEEPLEDAVDWPALRAVRRQII
jgi:sugar phosphate isomerase/epimerase